MSTRIGVLLAGFGGIGSQDHQSAMYLPAFAARSDFELVAAVDVAGTDGAAKAAREYRLRLYTDLADALADPAVTLVSVAAPLAARAEIVGQAIGAGKHVLADKPLAATVAEAEEIAHRAAERRVVVVPAHHLRLGGALQATRAAVRGGRIGLPWNVQADFLVAGGDPAPTGELVNLALYPIDIVRSLLGVEVRRVHALAGSHWHRSPQDLVTLLLDHEHGVTSTIVCGRMAGLRDVPPAGVVVHRYRVSGSHGMLATDATKPAVRVHSANRHETTWAGPDTVQALLDVVHAGVMTGHAELGPDDAVHVQRVVQAAARSLRTGRPVDIEPGSDCRCG
jgi:predicted dehydrogenase